MDGVGAQQRNAEDHGQLGGTHCWQLSVEGTASSGGPPVCVRQLLFDLLVLKRRKMRTIIRRFTNFLPLPRPPSLLPHGFAHNVTSYTHTHAGGNGPAGFNMWRYWSIWCKMSNRGPAGILTSCNADSFHNMMVLSVNCPRLRFFSYVCVLCNSVKTTSSPQYQLTKHNHHIPRAPASAAAPCHAHNAAPPRRRSFCCHP